MRGSVFEGRRRVRARARLLVTSGVAGPDHVALAVIAKTASAITIRDLHDTGNFAGTPGTTL